MRALLAFVSAGLLYVTATGCSGIVIRGVIRDKPTGNPIAAASVAVGDKNALTNAFGVYVLEDTDAKPSSVMMVNAPGYFLYSTSVGKKPGEDDELVRDVELVPKAEIAPRR
jgi:hypothetical protein